MEKKVTKEFAEESKAKTKNPIVQDMATKVIERERIKMGGQDAVTHAMLELAKTMDNIGSANVEVEEVEAIVNERLKDWKISVSNLDATVKAYLGTGGGGMNKPIPVTLTIQTPSGSKTIHTNLPPEIRYPLYQLLISDVQARNNSYLYGGAGTGKTFSAKTMKKLLGWDLITLECNQFTSKLDILGGQTIDGYQKGKLEMAWSNIREDGTKMEGCVLLLDELPKIDPNTAGILNGALAKIKDIEVIEEDDGTFTVDRPTIENGRNQKLEMGNIFIMASGNSRLNEADKDYEANFKQDLSLQDRFSGSTYKVFVNREMEWDIVMDREMAFIFIYLNKLRDAIEEQGFTNMAFVSVRLMMSMRDTYRVLRGKMTYQLPKKVAITKKVKGGGNKTVDETIFHSPKTLKQAVNSFLSSFQNDQIVILKEQSGYDDFLKIVETKNDLPIDDLNSQEELTNVGEIIQRYKAELEKEEEKN